MKNTGKTFVRAAALCLVLLCALAASSCSRSVVFGETVDENEVTADVSGKVTPGHPGTEKSDVESAATSEISGITVSGGSADRGIIAPGEAEESLSGFTVRAKFVRNIGTRMDPDLKAPVTEAEFRVLEVCQGEFDGDILVTEYNGGTVSMKDYADVYGKDSVEKLGLGDLTDEELENRTFTDPYEGGDRFDFEKKDPDTEYLIYITVNTDTGKTWLGDNGLTCLEIKDEPVTNPSHCVMMTAHGVTVSFDLPEGWSFEEDKEFERTYDAAVTFFPEDAPGTNITVGYREEPIGYCGTGLTTEEITLGGLRGIKMIYGDMRDYPWSNIILGNVDIMNRGFTNDLWTVWGNEIMAILDSITVE